MSVLHARVQHSARCSAAPLLPARSALRSPHVSRAAPCGARSGGSRTRPHRLAERMQVATTDDVTTTTPAAAPQEGAASEAINWYQQWYPMAIVGDLDRARPTAVKLLGRRLVLWYDSAASRWTAMEDRCPHRLAPLSEGRIEPSTGHLMCSYHGWQFDGSGTCTAIPQIRDPRAKASAMGSKRSCVTSYPVKEEQGLLWVWADPASKEAAESAPTSAVPEGRDPEGWTPRTGWFMRDVPCSLETVMENVLDPCHAPFSHHGVQGRRENEKGTTIRPLGPPKKGGFIMEQEGVTPRMTLRATFEFTAPNFIKYTFPSFGRIMAVYCVPTEAGWTRMITRFYKANAPEGARRGLAFALFMKVMELVEGNRVLEHALMRNTVLDGDACLLHVQERILLAGQDAAARDGSGAAASGWRQEYFMPEQFDTGVSSWRSWLDRFGREFPLRPRTVSDLPPEMTRQQVLDRYHQHTQHCPDCSRALARINAVLPALAAASAALLLLSGIALATGAAPLASLRVAGGVVAAALAAFAHHKLSKFRELFIFQDYVHAEKD